MKYKKITIKNTRDIFMERRLYNSKLVNSDVPPQIEKDFARYEQEIGKLIKDKILNKHEISLTMKEEASLSFFCVLLGFRSKNANDTFNNLTEEGKSMYGLINLLEISRSFGKETLAL